MYALERRAGRKYSGRLCTYWEQYALCCVRHPLEQVRAGQERPEDWRITKSSTSLGQLCRYPKPSAEQKKAS